MGVLQFNGTGDRLEWGTLATALKNLPTGACTVAALIKRNTTASADGTVYLKLGASPGVTKQGFTMTSTGVITDVSGGSGTTTNFTPSTNVWGVIMGKAAGTSTQRFSRVDLTAATAMLHGNATGTMADQVAGDSLEIGSWQDSDPFDGHIGLVAWWTGNMSDTDRANLFTNKKTSEWWTSAHGTPLFLAELNVAAASVVDLAGNATGSAHTGTTLDASQTLASWNFDGTGAAAVATPSETFSAIPLIPTVQSLQ